MDERTIDLIAQRVIAALRDDLEGIVAELSIQPETNSQLTVDQVARRLGVSCSTVYAHWREWGGYKLGNGDKAPIRFDGAALPIEPRLTPRPPVAVPPFRRARGGPAKSVGAATCWLTLPGSVSHSTESRDGHATSDDHSDHP